MTLEKSRMVTAENGPRPAGKNTECFYCHEAIGLPHKLDCVLFKKTVVVELKIPLLVTVPNEWDSDMMEFSWNESSRCFDDFIDQLESQRERMVDQTCLCFLDSEAKLLRDATQQDHDAFCWNEDAAD